MVLLRQRAEVDAKAIGTQPSSIGVAWTGSQEQVRSVGAALALALVYLVAGRLGLALATVGQSVTLVWPPSGLALAALLIHGVRLWPGVTLGAFTVNALTPGMPVAS